MYCTTGRVLYFTSPPSASAPVHLFTLCSTRRAAARASSRARRCSGSRARLETRSRSAVRSPTLPPTAHHCRPARELRLRLRFLRPAPIASATRTATRTLPMPPPPPPPPSLFLFRCAQRLSSQSTREKSAHKTNDQQKSFEYITTLIIYGVH